ncbi:hypothetical protein [Marininema halotolerans]|nr:hypothetical protein [Marininema halotolerans]
MDNEDAFRSIYAITYNHFLGVLFILPGKTDEVGKYLDVAA